MKKILHIVTNVGRYAAAAAIRACQHEPAFMARLDNTRAIADVDWRDYDAIYYTGGHGTMWGLPRRSRAPGGLPQHLRRRAYRG